MLTRSRWRRRRCENANEGDAAPAVCAVYAASYRRCLSRKRRAAISAGGGSESAAPQRSPSADDEELAAMKMLAGAGRCHCLSAAGAGRLFRYAYASAFECYVLLISRLVRLSKLCRQFACFSPGSRAPSSRDARLLPQHDATSVYPTPRT